MCIWWRTRHPALSVLLLLYFLLLFAKLNLATTNTLLLLGFLSDESFSSLGVYFTDLKPSWLRVTVQAYSVVFCSTKVFPPYEIEKTWIDLSTDCSTSPSIRYNSVDGYLTESSAYISEIISNGWDQVQGFNSHNPAQAKRKTILNNGPGILLNIPSLVSMQPRHTFGYGRPLHGTPFNLKQDR